MQHRCLPRRPGRLCTHPSHSGTQTIREATGADNRPIPIGSPWAWLGRRPRRRRITCRPGDFCNRLQVAQPQTQVRQENLPPTSPPSCRMCARAELNKPNGYGDYFRSVPSGRVAGERTPGAQGTWTKDSTSTGPTGVPDTGIQRGPSLKHHRSISQLLENLGKQSRATRTTPIPVNPLPAPRQSLP
jgi:hypothetical protein